MIEKARYKITGDISELTAVLSSLSAFINADFNGELPDELVRGFIALGDDPGSFFTINQTGALGAGDCVLSFNVTGRMIELMAACIAFSAERLVIKKSQDDSPSVGVSSPSTVADGAPERESRPE